MLNTIDRSIVLAVKRNQLAVVEVEKWLVNMHPSFKPIFGGKLLSHYFRVSANIDTDAFNYEDFTYAVIQLWNELEYIKSLNHKHLLLPVSLDNHLSLEATITHGRELIHTGKFVMARLQESYWIDGFTSPNPMGVITGPWDEIILEVILR